MPFFGRCCLCFCCCWPRAAFAFVFFLFFMETGLNLQRERLAKESLAEESEKLGSKREWRKLSNEHLLSAILALQKHKTWCEFFMFAFPCPLYAFIWISLNFIFWFYFTCERWELFEFGICFAPSAGPLLPSNLFICSLNSRKPFKGFTSQRGNLCTFFQRENRGKICVFDG